MFFINLTTFILLNILKKICIFPIINTVLNAGLKEPEFIGGDIDLRINIYRSQIHDTDLDDLNVDLDDLNDLNVDLDYQSMNLLKLIHKYPTLTYKEYVFLKQP